MHCVVHDHIDQIPAQAWNALHDGNTFVSHEFLHGLELTGCVKPETGWTPQHLVLYADASRGRILGAVPMYLKDHSYGEYVFDWSWAEAYHRAGVGYYPKLLVAVPFTPVAGPRLLAAAGDEPVRSELVRQALRHARVLNVSSLHWLFTSPGDTETLLGAGLMLRTGHQFHWINGGYADFDEYLGTFSAAKRKKIKRERRRVRDAGVALEVLTADDLKPMHWDAMYRFYRATVSSHGAIPYLNRQFFDYLAQTLADRVVLVLARHGGSAIGGSLNLLGAGTLYGRYWGAVGYVDALHFEACYYRPIEYCIHHGIERFEAGAQGEHKLARGLLPAVTSSLHWLRDSRFATAVADFLARETHSVQRYALELRRHSPFRDG